MRKTKRGRIEGGGRNRNGERGSPRMRTGYALVWLIASTLRCDETISEKKKKRRERKMRDERVQVIPKKSNLPPSPLPGSSLSPTPAFLINFI